MSFRSTAICLFLIRISFTTAAQADTIRVPIYGDSIENKIFEKVDIEASYPSGDSEWKKFLERNINGSIAVDNGAPIGIYTVYIQFIVSKDGSISDVKPLT